MYHYFICFYVCLLWPHPPLLRSWPWIWELFTWYLSQLSSILIFPELQFREFLSRSLFKCIHLSSAFSILLLSPPRDAFTPDVVILWCRICFVPFPKLFFSVLSPICPSCLSCFSCKFLSVFTVVVKIKLLFASSISGPSKPSCWFSSLVCEPHVTFYVLWFFFLLTSKHEYYNVIILWIIFSTFEGCNLFSDFPKPSFAKMIPCHVWLVHFPFLCLCSASVLTDCFEWQELT